VRAPRHGVPARGRPDRAPRARRDGSRRLVAPGIGDNGRGLAALLALAEAIDGRRVRTRRAVEFVATVGEEGLGDLRGAKHYFAGSRAGRAPAAAVVLDGAGDERVVHRAVGARRFRAEFRGPGGHSWAAFGAPNAVHAAARAAARLADLPLPSGQPGAGPRVTVSVGRIGGGMSVNAIPADAWLEIDLRATAADALDAYERTIRRAVEAAAAAENEIRAAGTRPVAAVVRVIGDRPAGALAPDHPLVAAAGGGHAPRRPRPAARRRLDRRERAAGPRRAGGGHRRGRPRRRRAHARRVVRERRGRGRGRPRPHARGGRRGAGRGRLTEAA
jgi:acetylornithine deacetylase/succinyl-diaminopimelate desuccinylase-like protein